MLIYVGGVPIRHATVGVQLWPIEGIGSCFGQRTDMLEQVVGFLSP